MTDEQNERRWNNGGGILIMSDPLTGNHPIEGVLKDSDIVATP